ncbi:hypothetical protein [Halarchaeum salinum]|uniref:Uncharacterized protein n=1 Tax=Halarchaeum salinum TaxID=489912 RepID=A0AAV3S6S7_9EURY
MGMFEAVDDENNVIIGLCQSRDDAEDVLHDDDTEASSIIPRWSSDSTGRGFTFTNELHGVTIRVVASEDEWITQLVDDEDGSVKAEEDYAELESALARALSYSETYEDYGIGGRWETDGEEREKWTRNLP